MHTHAPNAAILASSPNTPPPKKKKKRGKIMYSKLSKLMVPRSRTKGRRLVLEQVEQLTLHRLSARWNRINSDKLLVRVGKFYSDRFPQPIHSAYLIN